MMSGQLTFGLKASQQHASIDTLRRMWKIADAGGFDSCWAFDHFVPMGRDRTGDIFEAWTILAAMAEATGRVRVGTLVTGNIYRHPAVLAKMAVTVDHISAGRLLMGIGAGGDDYADTRLGLPSYPARERLARLDEACRLIQLLWSEETVTFHGEHYRLKDAPADPKPVQRPRPPIWIGSSGERYGLRVVARHADVWMNASLNPEDVDELTRLSRVLDRHCTDIGRDPATIRRGVQFRLPAGADDTIRAVERYVRAGFSDILFMPIGVGLPEIEATAELLPKLRALAS
jgi:F420-dependent oxidoreductase-like protein